MIGETLRVQGTLTSNEEIVVNGELSGQLQMNHRLTIGAKGKVDAGVQAKEVIIAGSVKGNVDAAERITLRAGANLVGDVKTAGIVIEDGAYFKGKVEVQREAAKPNASPATKPEPQVEARSAAAGGTPVTKR